MSERDETPIKIEKVSSSSGKDVEAAWTRSLIAELESYGSPVSPSMTVTCNYEGRVYKGTLYLVEDENA